MDDKHSPQAGASAEDDMARDDPAAPPGKVTAADRDLANYGAGGPQTFAAAAAATLAAATLPIDWTKVAAFLAACESSHPRVTYGLGKKVPSDTAAPGKDFTHVDCSGFVRAAIRRSTSPKAAAFPDGSVTQHDWVKAHGFPAGKVADGKLADGKVRIAFLDPHATKSGIGHVVLIHNGKTAESHGGVGPDSRSFDGSGWQAKTSLYLVTP
jgi:hypothetical protein